MQHMGLLLLSTVKGLENVHTDYNGAWVRRTSNGHRSLVSRSCLEPDSSFCLNISDLEARSVPLLMHPTSHHWSLPLPWPESDPPATLWEARAAPPHHLPSQNLPFPQWPGWTSKTIKQSLYIPCLKPSLDDPLQTEYTQTPQRLSWICLLPNFSTWSSSLCF